MRSKSLRRRAATVFNSPPNLEDLDLAVFSAG
jgi:hypothetical protein